MYMHIREPTQASSLDNVTYLVTFIDPATHNTWTYPWNTRLRCLTRLRSGELWWGGIVVSRVWEWWRLLQWCACELLCVNGIWRERPILVRSYWLILWVWWFKWPYWLLGVCEWSGVAKWLLGKCGEAKLHTCWTMVHRLHLILVCRKKLGVERYFLSHLHVFGSTCYIDVILMWAPKIRRSLLKVQELRVHWIWHRWVRLPFVWYGIDEYDYHLFDRDSLDCVKSQDIVIDEGITWKDWSVKGKTCREKIKFGEMHVAQIT